MGKIKVVSFDLEETLVTPDFSQSVWHEGIPRLYARRNDISIEEARAIVEREYDEVGAQRKEWYDIKYWLRRFQLGDYREVLERHKQKVSLYTDVCPVLSSLGRSYTLIVASSSAREFLPYLLVDIKKYFARTFSSISDHDQLKTLAFYLKVCQEMDILPHEMIHIGDSWQFDFLAAREAGIEAFHLDRRREVKDERSLKNLLELEARLQCR